jgi:hypothetical protein
MTEQRFAVFRRGGAMFSNIWAATSFIAWATERDFTPVIDFRHAEPMNRRLHSPGSDGWSDYFESVSEAPLDEVLNRDDTVFPEGRLGEFPVHDYSRNPAYRETFHQHIRLNSVMTQYVSLWQGLFASYGEVLGVHARGTDMKTAKSHQAPPELHQLFSLVDESLSRRPFDAVFVASEDEGSLGAFVKRYGNLVVTTDSFRTRQRTKLSRMNSNVLEWRYVLGMQVLRDAWLLSGCSGLISGSSNVSEHAQVIKNEPYSVNFQIRRPRVDVLSSRPGIIRVTNAARFLTTSRWRGGPDFRVTDRSGLL